MVNPDIKIELLRSSGKFGIFTYPVLRKLARGYPT
jgi:hypothetical protein